MEGITTDSTFFFRDNLRPGPDPVLRFRTNFPGRQLLSLPRLALSGALIRHTLLSLLAWDRAVSVSLLPGYNRKGNHEKNWHMN